MSGQLEPIRKAVRPDAEVPAKVPPHPVTGEDRGTWCQHEPDRLNVETRLYVWLLDSGAVPLDLHDCVMHDEWFMPDGRTLSGHEAAGFMPDLDDDLRAHVRLWKNEDLLRRARGSE